VRCGAVRQRRVKAHTNDMSNMQNLCRCMYITRQIDRGEKGKAFLLRHEVFRCHDLRTLHAANWCSQDINLGSGPF
jgi:hypothetical protein